MQVKALLAVIFHALKKLQEVAEAVRQSSARLEKAGLSHGDPWDDCIFTGK